MLELGYRTGASLRRFGLAKYTEYMSHNREQMVHYTHRHGLDSYPRCRLL
jgi:hypothetical protein